jgi:hypothetical protein
MNLRSVHPLPGLDSWYRNVPRLLRRVGLSLCAPLLLLGMPSKGLSAILQAPGGDAAPAPPAAAEESRLQPRFEVVCEGGCPPRVLGMAAAAAEAAWQESIAFLGVPHPELEAPLRIHLHRDLEEWRRMEEELTGGRFAQHRSFAHGPTRSAHVALHPGLPEAVLARYGPTPRTLRLVAHEAFHLVSMLAIPAAPLLPDWLAEGAATWIEQRVAERMGWSRGLSGDPIPSTYLWSARRLLLENRLPPARALILEVPEALGVDDYALAMLLVTHLREYRPDDLDRILEVAAALDPADPDAGSFLERTITGALGGPGFPGLDRSFRTFLAERRPLWVEVVRSLETAGNSWVQVGSTSGALAWRTETAQGETFQLEGVVEFPGRGALDWMRVVLGEEDGGWVEVRMDALRQVRVLRFPPATGEELEGELLAGPPLEPAPSVPAVRRRGEVVPFRIRVRGGGLEMESRGESLLRIDPGTLEDDGSWGIGTGPGVAVIWHNLRLSTGAAAAAILAR